MSAADGALRPDARPEEVGLDGARLARIDGWMRGWVDSGRLPGMLVAVVRRDRLVYGFPTKKTVEESLHQCRFVVSLLRPRSRGNLGISIPKLVK